MVAFDLIFLSPKAALIALGVVVPLAVLVLVARRGSRLRVALTVPRASRWRLAVPTLAAAAVAGLFGVAAASLSRSRRPRSRCVRMRRHTS